MAYILRSSTFFEIFIFSSTQALPHCPHIHMPGGITLNYKTTLWFANRVAQKLKEHQLSLDSLLTQPLKLIIFCSVNITYISTGHNSGLQSDMLATSHLRHDISLHRVCCSGSTRSEGTGQCNIFSHEQMWFIFWAYACHILLLNRKTGSYNTDCWFFIYCDLSHCNFRHVLERISNAIY